MPASSASIGPVVIMRTAVCVAVHQPNVVEQGSQVADFERCLFAVEASSGQCAFWACFCSARQHCLAFDVGQARIAALLIERVDIDTAGLTSGGAWMA